MNNRFSEEELKYNLPDYLSNNIEDRELITAIENELSSNALFRSEFEDMKNTLSFLQTSNFEDAPAGYFNNLSVRINERIDSGESVSYGFFERLGLIWKILIPAIPVVIIAVLLLFNSKDNIEKIDTKNNEQEKTGFTENKTQEKESLLQNKNTQVEEVHKNEKIANIQTKHTQTKLKTGHNEPVEYVSTLELLSAHVQGVKGQPAALIADNFELIEENNSTDDVDIMIISSEDDDTDSESIDDEFMKLTPEEQKEIIDKLLKAQI